MAEVASPVTASATLSYLLATGTSGIRPNTTFTAQWRVTYVDGTANAGPPVSVTYADTRFNWKVASGPIVRLHWYTGDDAFGARGIADGRGRNGQGVRPPGH